MMRLLSRLVEFSLSFKHFSVCGAVVVVLLGTLVLRSGWKSRLLNRRDKIILGIRALSEIGAAFCTVNALFNMELANMTAILQILPLTIPLTAFVFLGETLGWRRLMVIGIEFIRMLLIVKLGSDGFNAYSLFGLAAVVCVTIRDTTARSLRSKLSSQEISFSLGWAVFKAATYATVYEPWIPITFVAWASLIGSSVEIFFWIYR